MPVSSSTLLQALLWDKLSVLLLNRNKNNMKTTTDVYQTSSYMNIHLKHDLRMEFVV